MSQDWAFTSDCTLTDIIVINLEILAWFNRDVKQKLTPAKMQTSVITSTKSLLPKCARACRTTRRAYEYVRRVSIKRYIKLPSGATNLTCRTGGSILDICQDLADCRPFGDPSLGRSESNTGKGPKTQ